MLKLKRLNHENLTDEVVKKMALWRKQNQEWYPSVFKVTYKGTRKWAEGIINNPERELYLLYWNKEFFGHMGFNYIMENSCDLDCVLKGEDIKKGLMSKALLELIDIAFFDMGKNFIYLTVMSDNLKALNLYRRCGFYIYKEIPLKWVKNHWIETTNRNTNKFNTYMKLENNYVYEMGGLYCE